MQLVVYFPLYEALHFPANASIINRIIISIATLDLLPTNLLNEMIYYLPDMDPYNLNFSMYDYDTTIFVDNMDCNLWI